MGFSCIHRFSSTRNGVSSRTWTKFDNISKPKRIISCLLLFLSKNNDTEIQIFYVEAVQRTLGTASIYLYVWIYNIHEHTYTHTYICFSNMFDAQKDKCAGSVNDVQTYVCVSHIHAACPIGIFHISYIQSGYDMTPKPTISDQPDFPIDLVCIGCHTPSANGHTDMH